MHFLSYFIPIKFGRLPLTIPNTFTKMKYQIGLHLKYDLIFFPYFSTYLFPLQFPYHASFSTIHFKKHTMLAFLCLGSTSYRSYRSGPVNKYWSEKYWSLNLISNLKCLQKNATICLFASQWKYIDKVMELNCIKRSNNMKAFLLVDFLSAWKKLCQTCFPVHC